MPLFQQSVLKKYINDLDKERLSASWKVFQKHFHNAAKQEHIRNIKEEQYQEGFLRELFVDVLGYTLNPQPGFDLTTEYKNEKDSKKADGAILKAGAVRAVIELKGTDTTDLSKIETQAFGYLHNQKGCTYVITSNFEKLRFYIQDATEFIEFNLFMLGKDAFDLLYLCLQKDSLLADVPLQVKQQSVTQEDAITKKLYADYSSFKKALYQNLVEQNPQLDKIELFKKTQKLLDRFLFILFAEDRLLLPPNFIVKIVAEYKEVQRLRMQQTLYERFKIYFSDLLQGNKTEDIFAYNGGLFEPDEVLDNLKIDDAVLQQGVITLSNYDYNTEVDVNILGHIFEHSLNQIEELQASLEQTAVEKNKTRRKKEGVFYTPRYITKYIVENTVGALCKEKKQAMQVVEEDYAPAAKKTKATEAERKRLIQKLDDYRNWLLQLTICDPACGSGAFLNAALEFLIAEHNYIDELTNKLMGSGTLGFRWTPNDILEHNLFGVDINEEAVEIARLSLWLRTAQKGRKLSNLSSNIKCGNSLIDDKEIAGEKAFVWKEQFKKVFDEGGFDVVIGNPPYLRLQGLRENFDIESRYFEYRFMSATGRFDIYVLFIEVSYELIKEKGIVSFILPHKFSVSEFGHGIRKFLVENKAVKALLSFGSEIIFEEAATYTSILTLKKNNKHLEYVRLKVSDLFNNLPFQKVSYESLSDEKWNLYSDDSSIVFDKINSQPYKSKNIFENISQGVVTICDDIFILTGFYEGQLFRGYSERLRKYITLEADIVKPFVKGENIQRYEPINVNKYVIYLHEERDNKTFPIEETKLSEYALTYEYLNQFKDELIQRKLKYKTNPKYWYTLHRSREKFLLERPKLLMRNFSFRSQITFDEEKLFYNSVSYGLTVKDDDLNILKQYLPILNSQLMWFYMINTSPVLRGGFVQYKTTYVEEFSLPNINENHSSWLITKADIMLSKNKELHGLKQNLIKFLQAKHEGLTISKKLADWPQLSFKDFLKELEKQKIKLSLAEQNEWLQYFEAEKAKGVQLQNTINSTDKEIDAMVYQLYGLTEEEIKIVEGT